MSALASGDEAKIAHDEGIQRNDLPGPNSEIHTGFCSFGLTNLLTRVRPVYRQHAKRDINIYAAKRIT